VIPEAEHVYAGVLAREDGPVVARDRSGAAVELRAARWLAGAGAADLRMLALARGPVLDVGCGPGRHVRALARLGVEAMGIDASAAAVRVARSRGTAVVHGSIFEPVPSAGRWRTALLLDGNIGIGGDPAALLARVAGLLAATGRVLCECEPPGTGLRTGPVRLEHRHRTSRWFPWAHVGIDALAGVAADARLAVRATWEDCGRWFARLEAP
jgi:SAM-dependent methyltransferase